MIYRPVRERDPNAIIDTVLRAVDKGGYDEASLTSLSTADYSCIDPLVKGIMKKLRERRVSLGVSSLRAYGLNESLLDEIRSVRATGLTFAPEAGTQRMRDVVNKNVSEEDITRSAHRIFSRGWDRMKLYFMIGLPTEEDLDVTGIVETGARMRNIGRRYHGRRAQVTVSVSSHVPKPHTPFQWAAMDSTLDITRKQQMLGSLARQLDVKVRWHDSRVSYLEGIASRGDRRVADVIEAAWRKGARFDGWDDQLRFDMWTEALVEATEIDPLRYLGTIPVDGGLPWDHISVGLADNFLKKEWKRTLKSKLSPPCGKPVGDIIHHTNAQDAQADERKLVCYHCGVACDMKQMRQERVDFLESLGALEPPEVPTTDEDYEAPLPPRSGKPKPPKRDAPAPADMIRYRLQYVKDGLIRLQGHSDMLRVLPRVFRRAQLPVGYSWGFKPKPLLSFTPATPLGTWSVSELMEISLSASIEDDDLLKRLNAVADPGLTFIAARCMPREEKGLAKNLVATDYLVALPGQSREAVAKAVMKVMSAEQLEVRIRRKKAEKVIDARPAIEFVRLADPSEWPTVLADPADGPLMHLRMKLNMPSARPTELIEALFGDAEIPPQVVRLAFWRSDGDGQMRSPMIPTPLAEVVENENKAEPLTPTL
jgi:radical SAM-linked protein